MFEFHPFVWPRFPLYSNLNWFDKLRLRPSYINKPLGNKKHQKNETVKRKTYGKETIKFRIFRYRTTPSPLSKNAYINPFARSCRMRSIYSHYELLGLPLSAPTPAAKLQDRQFWRALCHLLDAIQIFQNFFSIRLWPFFPAKGVNFFWHFLVFLVFTYPRHTVPMLQFQSVVADWLFSKHLSTFLHIRTSSVKKNYSTFPILAKSKPRSN